MLIPMYHEGKIEILHDAIILCSSPIVLSLFSDKSLDIPDIKILFRHILFNELNALFQEVFIQHIGCASR